MTISTYRRRRRSSWASTAALLSLLATSCTGDRIRPAFISSARAPLHQSRAQRLLTPIYAPLGSVYGSLVTKLSSAVQAEVVDCASGLGSCVDESIGAGTFVRATLTQWRGGGQGEEEGPEKVQARIVQLSKGPKLQLVFRYARQDKTKNYDVEAAGSVLADQMRSGFTSGRVFTTAADLIFEPGERVKRVKATFKEQPDQSHDKAKKRRLAMPSAGQADTAPGKAAFLQELGVLGPSGQPRSGMADKLRQIERFVEILEHLLESSEDLKAMRQGGGRLTMLDGGAGKGYLTFAAYHHLREQGFDVHTTGIDIRKDLCDRGNELAQRLGFESLSFVQGTIDDVALAQHGQGQGASVVVALHACDTATDEALFHGVRLGASVIICAPCCHKEVRRQVEATGLTSKPTALQGVLRHGILLERQAEIVTDAIRALALELAGYKAQVLEFISNDHTRKNLMITAVKRSRAAGAGELKRQRERLTELLRLYGVRDQRLLSLMGMSVDPHSFELLAAEDRAQPIAKQ